MSVSSKSWVSIFIVPFLFFFFFFFFKKKKKGMDNYLPSPAEPSPPRPLSPSRRLRLLSVVPAWMFISVSCCNAP